MNRRNEEQRDEMRFIDRLRHFTYDLSVYIQYFIAFAIIVAIIVTLLSLPIQILLFQPMVWNALQNP